MSDQKKENTQEKRGILLTSQSPISLHYVKSPQNSNKFMLTYAATSDTPISLTFKTDINFDIFAERSESESDASDVPPHPTKKQKKSYEREVAKFWSNGTGLLPDFLTRQPKSENAARIQHTLLIETAYMGKANMASLRSDNERLQWDKEKQEKEISELKAKVLEQSMRIDILERNVIRARSDSNKSNSNGSSEKEAVTSPEENKQSRKSPTYHIPQGQSPNTSIFSHMHDSSIAREDHAVVRVSKHKIPPLMGVKTSPPTTSRPTTPTFQLAGKGHFNFSTKRGMGRGNGSTRGGFNQRGFREPLRGRAPNRYEDAIQHHRWQNETFSSPSKITPRSKPLSPVASSSTGSAMKAPPNSPNENKRITRSKSETKQEENPKPKPKEDQDDDSDDGEVLRISTTIEDEEFMAKRLLEDYESYY